MEIQTSSFQETENEDANGAISSKQTKGSLH
jgi:hypothetical protein